VNWGGDQGPDIPAISGGNYHLYYDVQFAQVPSGAWQDWIIGTTSTGATFTSPVPGNATFTFRVRARAEQPEGQPGAWPNHRFPGVWEAPRTVAIVLVNPTGHRVFLPRIN
jgi:hypothetical protein